MIGRNGKNVRLAAAVVTNEELDYATALPRNMEEMIVPLMAHQHLKVEPAMKMNVLVCRVVYYNPS